MFLVFTIISLILFLIVLTLFLEVLFSFLPGHTKKSSKECNANCVVLIPAHNESSNIVATLENIKTQLSEGDSILVIADNCSDDTATIALSTGVNVVERTDMQRKGKGYALDYGIQQLKHNPPDVVVIIDADCKFENEALKKLVCKASETDRPVQALDLMNHPSPSIKQRISTFAWIVKNHVRPLGLYNIGMPCQLMGTGMAFPWGLISSVKLATGHIVEDMKLGLDLAMQGHAPLFSPDVIVTSTFPEKLTAEKLQKRRWEHGHLSVIFSLAPMALLKSLFRMSPSLFVMSADLFIPPLALLSLLIGLDFLLALFIVGIGNNLLFLISLGNVLMLLLAIGFSWLRWGREVVSFFDLLLVPVYIIKKIPMYLSAITHRQKDWVRTDRDTK